jgi:phosphocarrier protein HPr
MAADDRAEVTLQIVNELGLHMRAGTQFVKLAAKYPCEITVTKNSSEVNGKSILSLMTLMAPKGTTITIRAKGDRSEEAVAALAALIADKFGEGK